MPKKPNDMFQMERKEDAIGVGDGADFIVELSPKSKKRESELLDYEAIESAGRRGCGINVAADG
jgi:hypothetical protein